MGSGKAWTENQIKALRNAYDDPDITIKDIAEVMNRTKYAITCQAKKLHIYKRKEDDKGGEAEG